MILHPHDSSTKLDDWKPIESAPSTTTVVVSDEFHWTLGRLISRDVLELQMRWPLIKRASEWVWVGAHTGRKIGFIPTHWMWLDFRPPQ